jgi:hypothetical protein
MNAALVTLNGDIDTCSEWVRTQLQVSSNESFNSSDACTAQALSEFWPQYMRALEDIGKTATMLAVAFDGGGGVDDANEGLVRKLDATFVEYAQLVQRSLHIVRVDCGTYCIKQVRACTCVGSFERCMHFSYSITSTQCAHTCEPLQCRRIHIGLAPPGNCGRTPIRRLFVSAPSTVSIDTPHRCTHLYGMQYAK